jgi:hypothetical protein
MDAPGCGLSPRAESAAASRSEGSSDIELGRQPGDKVSRSRHLPGVDGAGVDVHAIIVSAAVGIEKPDHSIFKMALKAVGARPSDAIHVGDNRLDMNERPALASTRSTCSVLHLSEAGTLARHFTTSSVRPRCAVARRLSIPVSGTWMTSSAATAANRVVTDEMVCMEKHDPGACL